MGPDRRPQAREHHALSEVLQAAATVANRLKLPAEMITLHGQLREAKLPSGDTLQGSGQHTLRWGAFLLTYAPLEGFFNEILGNGGTRTIPLNPDKLRDKAMSVHNIQLFTRCWSVRTLVPPESGQFAAWHLFNGAEEIRRYLADMKALRDRLIHGGDQFTTTNASGAMWSRAEGPSLRMLGVEGFLQAATDIVTQTVDAYGGSHMHVPIPEPLRHPAQSTRPALRPNGR